MIKQLAQKLLERTLRKKDGIDKAQIEAAENRLGVKLPRALYEFYLNVGDLECFTSSFEEFAAPDKLTIKNSKLLFLEENQGVCWWAADINDENPPVYMQTEENGEWYDEQVRLEAFITILMYYQLAQGGYENCGCIYEVGDTELREITSDWEQVVNHNGLIIYAEGGKLIWYFTDKEGNILKESDGSSLLYTSTRTKKQLREMDKRYGFAEL